MPLTYSTTHLLPARRAKCTAGPANPQSRVTLLALHHSRGGYLGAECGGVATILSPVNAVLFSVLFRRHGTVRRMTAKTALTELLFGMFRGRPIYSKRKMFNVDGNVGSRVNYGKGSDPKIPVNV